MSTDYIKIVCDVIGHIREKHKDQYDGKKPKQHICGEMVCPKCGTGTIHYSVASYNGHVHARCSTNKCVFFIQ